MPQRPSARRKQKKRRTRKLAEWRCLQAKRQDAAKADGHDAPTS